VGVKKIIHTRQRWAEKPTDVENLFLGDFECEQRIEEIFFRRDRKRISSHLIHPPQSLIRGHPYYYPHAPYRNIMKGKEGIIIINTIIKMIIPIAIKLATGLPSLYRSHHPTDRLEMMASSIQDHRLLDQWYGWLLHHQLMMDERYKRYIYMCVCHFLPTQRRLIGTEDSLCFPEPKRSPS
jgi:hypothetical protein